MTNDELLEKINLSFKDIPVDYGQADAHKALCAVVELHKPIHNVYPNGNEFTECSHCNNGCWGCEEWGCDSKCNCKCHQAGNEYPCPTIKAIEGVLND